MLNIVGGIAAIAFWKEFLLLIFALTLGGFIFRAIEAPFRWGESTFGVTSQVDRTWERREDGYDIVIVNNSKKIIRRAVVACQTGHSSISMVEILPGTTHREWLKDAGNRWDERCRLEWDFVKPRGQYRTGQ